MNLNNNFMNAGMDTRELTIDMDLTNSKVLSDDDEADVEGIKELTGVVITENKITLSPLTATIIKK